jgi:hypothetical protein
VDEESSILSNVIEEAVRFDHTFQKALRDWPESTRQALVDFWAQPQWADIAPYVAPPDGAWEVIHDYIERLIGRAAADLPERRWQELASAAEALSSRDPLAGCMVAMYAVAGYQGSAKRSSKGWHAVVPLLGRALLGTNALHATKRLIGVSLRRLQADIDQTEPHPSLAEYSDLLDAVQRRFAIAYSELAWELRRSCSNQDSALRGEVAALFWSSGDVPHSRLMREHNYVPPFPVIRRLVERTVRQIPDDPLVQFVWLVIKEHAPFAIRDHRTLFPRINLVYRTGATAQLETLPSGLDAVFAHCVVHYFRGSLTQEDADSYSLTLASYAAFPLDVRFQTRLLGLHYLLSGEHEGWRDLADRASRAAREAAGVGDLDDYDLALDIPFYYVNNDRDALEEQLTRIEVHRCCAQWRWLRMFRPGAPKVTPSAQNLVELEKSTLGEMRWALFKMLIAQLPVGQQFDHRMYTDGAPFNPARTAEELKRHEAQLERVWDELESFAPSYVHIRRDPVVKLDDLAFLLKKAQPL